MVARRNALLRVITASMLPLASALHIATPLGRRSRATPMMSTDFAILFDCDGVLADTERDGHRVSFNKVFAEQDLGFEWEVEEYGRLCEVGGGKERMTHYFNINGWPIGYQTPTTTALSKGLPVDEARLELVQGMHKRKTALFQELIGEGVVPLRPGILRIVDEAIAEDVPLAVCSTSNEAAVRTLVQTLMGDARYSKFAFFCGDVVNAKKPAPDVYNLAAETMGLDKNACVVIEDSGIGNMAAKAAGMSCLVTMSTYTVDEDFSGADRIVGALGEPGDAEVVTLADLRALLPASTVAAPIREPTSPPTTLDLRQPKAPKVMDELWSPVKEADIRIEGGGTIRTFQMPAHAERVQYILTSPNGRPVKAKVELWIGPIRSVHELIYDCIDGEVFPIKATLTFKKVSPVLKISTDGSYAFPLECGVFVPSPDESKTIGKMTEDMFYSAPLKERVQGGSTIDNKGGAIRTFDIDPAWDKTQIMVWSKDVGRKSFKTNIEILQGPNNAKQHLNLRCGGSTQPFHAVIDTPGSGWVMRCNSKKYLEDGLFQIAVAPYGETIDYDSANDVVIGGSGFAF